MPGSWRNSRHCSAVLILGERGRKLRRRKQMATSKHTAILKMATLKKVTLAAALIAGATSLAMAQGGYQSPGAGGTNGNNSMPPKAYKGPGAMQSYSASKFRSNPGLYNQASDNAHGNGMPPKGYKGPGAMQNYSASEFGGRTAANAAASGGGGTHATSEKTGSAENTQKVIGNQNGYRGLYGSYRSGPGPEAAAGGTAWCEAHFRSYDPSTGMYRTFGGVMRACP
jgi:hypothetical protein